MIDEQDPRSPGGDQGPHDCDPEYTGETCGNPLFHIPRVRHDEDQWNSYPKRRSVDYCGVPILRGFNFATRMNGTWGSPCGLMSHRACAEQRVSQWVVRLAQVWRSVDAVYFASYIGSKRSDARVRQRRRGANWFRVDRLDGTVCQFADRALGGRLEPKAWTRLTPEQAMWLAVGAMSLPGVVRVDASDGWGFSEPEDRPSSMKGFGAVADRDYEIAFQVAAEEMMLRFGVMPVLDEELPGAIPREAWFEALRLAIEALRASRDTHGEVSGAED